MIMEPAGLLRTLQAPFGCDFRYGAGVAEVCRPIIKKKNIDYFCERFQLKKGLIYSPQACQ
jgi:hypothetical protein